MQQSLQLRGTVFVLELLRELVFPSDSIKCIGHRRPENLRRLPRFVLQRLLGAPTKTCQPSDIQKLPRRPVRTRGVEDKPPTVTHNVCYELCELRDHYILSGSHVEELIPRVVFHNKDACIGKVVNKEEFSARLPVPHTVTVDAPASLASCKSADEGSRHVGMLRMVIVTGPVEVRRASPK